MMYYVIVISCIVVLYFWGGYFKYRNNLLCQYICFSGIFIIALFFL